jgi:hypothetical protein
MGANNSKNNSETINWNKINTNDMSSTIPNIKGISNEANQLISKLKLPEISENNSSEINTLKILNNKTTTNDVLLSDSFDSNSSPFITSEMYNYIINNYKTESKKLKGGGQKNQKGGDDMEDLDNSSTSSTSSASSMSEDISSESKKKNNNKKIKHDKKNKKESKKNKKAPKKESDSEIKSPQDSEQDSEQVSEQDSEQDSEQNSEPKSESDSDSDKELTGGSDLSYESSTAHTGGNYTETISNENISIKSSSIHTSDINMISE